METHLALMRMLAAQHGTPPARMLNAPPPSRLLDGGIPGAQPALAGGLFGAPDALARYRHNQIQDNAEEEEPSANAQRLAQILLANTKNPGYSHQAAMTGRFMQNVGAR